MSYISWTVSVYIMTYYTLKKPEVDTTYRVCAMLLWISSIWLYKIEKRELTKEIIKSTFILIATTLVPFFIDAEIIDIHQMVTLTICNIINATVCYAFIWIMKKSYQLHGEKSYKLETTTLIVVSFSMFILKLEIIISLLIGLSINLIWGYQLFKKSRGIGRERKYHTCSMKKQKRMKKKK